MLRVALVLVLVSACSGSQPERAPVAQTETPVELEQAAPQAEPAPAGDELEMCAGVGIPNELRQCSGSSDCELYEGPRACQNVAARADARDAIVDLVERCRPDEDRTCLGNGFLAASCEAGTCVVVDAM